MTFCDFATDAAYDWSIRSAHHFGAVFSQVITPHNRITHSQENESRPEKRAFSLQELSQLFDLLDLEYERILDSGRNGALTHLRDTAAFKLAYAWGLRENEVRHLQLVDFSPNYRAPYFGDFGTLNVRWGKSNKGQAHKPRNVLTVFDWSAEVAEDWITQVLPRYGHPLSDLFPTNTGGIVSGSHLWRRMSGALDELGFPPGLDFHSLRRSYSTHLLTVYGYDLKFVSLQLGHEHAATTSAAVAAGAMPGNKSAPTASAVQSLYMVLPFVGDTCHPAPYRDLANDSTRSPSVSGSSPHFGRARSRLRDGPRLRIRLRRSAKRWSICWGTPDRIPHRDTRQYPKLS